MKYLLSSINKLFRIMTGFIVLLIMILIQDQPLAQAGTLDPTFNSGSGANSYVNSTVIQSDGKIIVGGEFYLYNTVNKNHIARLNQDGSIDASFNLGTGANDIVYAIAIQGDGKILISGEFTNYDGTVRNHIARLNTDGTIDVNFNPGAGSDFGITTMAIQSDGKIVIGGGFTTYNGVTRRQIARIYADGSLDISFNPGTGANNMIRSVAIQNDGKILIGGDFISYNGIAINRIARLDSNGSLDTSFNPGTGASFSVFAIVLQSDGKIIITGTFTNFNGTARNRIARLNTDGSLDASFNPGTGANSIIFTAALQTDKKIIIAGDFTTYNSTGIRRVARLNVDGSLDASFNPGTGPDLYVQTLAIQADAKLIIGGNFSSYNGTSAIRIARLNAPDVDRDGDSTPDYLDGCPDDAGKSNPGSCGCGVADTDTDYDGTPNCNDGCPNDPNKTNPGTCGCGVAETNNCVGHYDIDRTYGTNCGVTSLASIGGVSVLGNHPFCGGCRTGLVKASFRNPDNSIINVYQVQGEYSGTVGIGIVKLDANGQLVNSFGTGGSVYFQEGNCNHSIYSVDTGANGKIYITGTTTCGADLVCFNADGTLKYHYTNNTESFYSAVVAQPDGKAICFGRRGDFYLIAKRFNSDGTVDNSYGSFSPQVRTLSVSAPGHGIIQSDNKVVFCVHMRNPADLYLIRFNTNGTLDNSFGNGGFLQTGFVQSCGSQNEDDEFSFIKMSDDRMVLGGSSTGCPGVPGNSWTGKVMRLTVNGLPDNSFGTNGIVTIPQISDQTGINDIAIDPATNDIYAVGRGRKGTIYKINSSGNVDLRFEGVGYKYFDGYYAGMFCRMFSRVALYSSNRIALSWNTSLSDISGSGVAVLDLVDNQLSIVSNPSCPNVLLSVNDQNTACFSWQWYKNNVAIIGANSSTYLATSCGDYFIEGSYTAPIGLPPGTTRSNVITINPNAGMISGQSAVCIGTNTTYTSNGDACGSWGSSNTLVATVDANTGQVTAISEGETDISYTMNLGCGNPFQAVKKIIVYPPITGNTIQSDQTICTNTSPELLITGNHAVGGSGIFTYIWQSSSDGVNWVNIQAISSPLFENYNPGNLNTSMYFRRTAISHSGCGSMISNPVLITVNPSVTYFQDADIDGYGNPAISQTNCNGFAPQGYVTNNSDCNDADATIHSPQLYFVDSDHDGFGSTSTELLCSSTPPEGYSTDDTDCNDNDESVHTPQPYYVDADHDGFGSTSIELLCSSTPPEGYSTDDTDCNDNDESVHTLQLYYLDADHDGFGSTSIELLCTSTPPEGYSTDDTDCNDNDESVHTLQLYYVDADGDGFGCETTAMLCSSIAPEGYSTDHTDCNDNDASVHTPQLYYVDADHDGFGSTSTELLCTSTSPEGYSTDDTDCNDNDESVHTPQLYYVDEDGDGFGCETIALLCSSIAPFGYSTDHTDCNDNDVSVHAIQSYFVDSDHDGYGSMVIDMICASSPPEGFSSNNTDCNDDDGTIHSPQSYYVDSDHDGYGSSTIAMICSSTSPIGFSTNNSDCNDNDATVHDPVLYYIDADHDGYGSALTDFVCSIEPPVGYSINSSDCNDSNNSIHPNATEICGNGIDDNCNGQSDEGCGGCANDNVKPTITCVSNKMRTANNGLCTYKCIGAEFNPLSVTDNCGVSNLSYYLTGATTGNGNTSLTGVVFKEGITIVNWKAIDVAGNSATCSFTVTVNTTDSDCDGIGDPCDVCPGGNDKVDNNNDGKPDCKYLPSYNEIPASWKSGNNKVYICHIPPGNPNNSQTLSVSYNAVKAHLDHGDYLGPCGNASCGSICNDPGKGKGKGKEDDHDHGNENEHGKNDDDDDDHDHGNGHDFKKNSSPGIFEPEFAGNISMSINSNQLNVYPNPAKELLYVNFKMDNQAPVYIQIFNYLGQELSGQQYFCSKNDETIISLNTQNYSNGLYIIKVTFGEIKLEKIFAIVK